MKSNILTKSNYDISYYFKMVAQSVCNEVLYVFLYLSYTNNNIITEQSLNEIKNNTTTTRIYAT